MTAAPSPAAQQPDRLPDGFRHGFVPAAAGTRIHYVTGGQGSPVVLLHGWPQSWWEWRDVLAPLAQQHTVIAVDLPGMGASTGPETGIYDKRTTARLLRDAVRDLGFTHVDLVAHDIGAQIAYRWARDFPAEVGHLVAMESLLPAFGLEDDFAVNWHYKFLASAAPFPEQVVNASNYRPFYSYFLAGAAHHPERVDIDRFLAEHADPGIRHAGFEYYRAAGTDAADNQADADQHRLPMPVLALGGQYLFGTRVGTMFTQVADRVETVVVPDAGHYIAEENPAFLADRVMAFLARP